MDICVYYSFLNIDSKENMSKDRNQKTVLEMDFDEFHSWATGYVLFAIGEGTSLRDAMLTVCDQSARNKVWGGGSGKGPLPIDTPNYKK